MEHHATHNVAGTAIGVVGLSHLGLVSSICYAHLGWHVVALDSCAEAVQALIRQQLPVSEPGLAAMLEQSADHLLPETDFSALGECETVFVTLDTETDALNQVVIEKLDQLIEKAVPFLKTGVRLVLMSQVPVGFTRRLRERIRAMRPDLRFLLYYWVETLVIGDAVNRCLAPERIILGCESTEETGHGLECVTARFNCPVFTMSFESAELAKAAINFYLSVSVTFANTLADLCEVSGASMSSIIPALRSDRRIGAYAYLRPGLGIAGGNIERDIIQLQRLGQARDADTRLVDCVVDFNAVRYKWVTRQLKKQFTADEHRTVIGVWGFAYKRDTRSIRNSRGVEILRELAGTVEIRAYDPAADLPSDLKGRVSTGSRMDVVAGADCLLVLTDWPEFTSSDLSDVARRMRGRIIIDAVGIIDRARASENDLKLISPGDASD